MALYFGWLLGDLAARGFFGPAAFFVAAAAAAFFFGDFASVEAAALGATAAASDIVLSRKYIEFRSTAIHDKRINAPDLFTTTYSGRADVIEQRYGRMRDRRPNEYRI